MTHRQPWSSVSCQRLLIVYRKQKHIDRSLSTTAGWRRPFLWHRWQPQALGRSISGGPSSPEGSFIGFTFTPHSEVQIGIKKHGLSTHLMHGINIPFIITDCCQGTFRDGCKGQTGFPLRKILDIYIYIYTLCMDSVQYKHIRVLYLQHVKSLCAAQPCECLLIRDCRLTSLKGRLQP